MEATDNILPKSIQERAIQNVISGMEPEEAIKKAFEQEEEFIYSLLGPCGNLSKIGNQVAEVICKDVYQRLNQKP